MRKLIIGLLMAVLIFSGCSKKQETIEGYWMAENGETISFNSNGKAISDGMTMDYSLYGEDNLSISFWGMASEYKYTVKNDVLTLVDLKKNATSIFYRNEEKQKEIQTKLNQIKLEKEKQEKLDKERKEYEDYISGLKDRIVKIDNEISDINGYIDDDNKQIVKNKEDIQKEKNKISEIEKEISKLQGSAEDTAEGDIEYLRGEQEYHSGNIEYHNGEIEYYNNEIVKYKNKIKEYQKEKEEITKELKAHGEY